MCRGSGEGDSSSVVSCSHPEPSATILGKNADLAAAAIAGRTGWAGRVSQQAARAARSGESSGQDAGTWGGAGMRAGGRSVIHALSCRLLPLPACRRRQRRGCWEGEVARGSLESNQGWPPSWDREEGQGFS